MPDGQRNIVYIETGLRVGVVVRCAVCGDMKKPIGRSGPLGASYCDDDCDGYRKEPYPGSLWPGETEEEFGFPVGSHGTIVRR